MALDDPALPLTRAADRLMQRAACRRQSSATRTTMLEQKPKSSRLSAYLRKLHVDFLAKSSMGWGMVSDDEIDPTKVRTGLFALITARLEDAHEFAVKGQSAKTDNDQIASFVSDIRSNLDEIHIHLDAIELIKNL